MIEKITEKIISDSEQAAKQIIENAKDEAYKISDNENEKLNLLLKEYEENLNKETNIIKKRCESSIRLMRKQALGGARLQVIDEVIRKSEKNILDMEDSAYFNAMKKILSRIELEKGVVIKFNKRDMERMKNTDWGKAVLGREYADIDGGFILSYDNAEENFSISNIIKYRYDELCDMLNTFFKESEDEGY